MAFPRLNNISFWVRGCTLNNIESKALRYFFHMSTTSGLGEEENSELNRASLLKGDSDSSQDESRYLRVVLSMVKAKLLEEYFQCDSRNGPLQTWHEKSQMLKLSARSDFKKDNLNKITLSNFNGKNVQPKERYVLLSRTVGWPKGSNAQGHGAIIVPAWSYQTLYANLNRFGRERMAGYNTTLFRRYSTGGASFVPDKFVNLVNRCEKHPSDIVDRDVYKLLLDPNMYLLAYHKLKSKPGNMTPGMSSETLDGLNSEWIDQIISSMKNESFQFQPSRRVNIPKPKGDTRPLSVAPPRDKIVQEIMRMILEAIFAPTFSLNSHGFMTNRSCYTALKQVYTRFKGVTWVIEGDIYKCLDSIDHHKLMKIIEGKILDRRFTRLIWKSLKAGYFEFNVYKYSISGSPQGSIVSPTLCNIFMDQLDQYIEYLASKFNKGDKPKINNEYIVHANALARANKREDQGRMDFEISEMRKLNSVDFYDPYFRRLYYVRYADDWIIGIKGSHQECKEILNKVENKLTDIGLTLNKEKTKITNLNKDKVMFLGTYIFRSHHQRFTMMNIGAMIRLGLGIRMEAPLDKIRDKLTSAGFIQDGRSAPKFIWISQNKDQILHLYNSVYREIMNYYSFAHNINQV